MTKVQGFLRKFTGYTNRYGYWSNSEVGKFLEALFGLKPSPTAATAEEWDSLRRINKTRSKIGNWIVEELLDTIQDIIYFPHDIYVNIRAYWRNRFRDKLHYLPTKLKPGKYYEVNHRILHGLMETLVDFVEGEKAHMYSWGKDEEDYVPLPPREAGIAHLDWEISLGDESPGQSEAAKEIKEIYLWWKDVRPTRPDPMTASGWSDYCDERREDGEMAGLYKTPEKDRERVDKMLKDTHDLEEQFENEDTEMLIRIIKVRRSMWT